jgi:hypothetical protein
LRREFERYCEGLVQSFFYERDLIYCEGEKVLGKSVVRFYMQPF